KGLRQDKSAEALLRVLLLHVGGGFSLRETVVRARAARLADLSDVALREAAAQKQGVALPTLLRPLAGTGCAPGTVGPGPRAAAGRLNPGARTGPDRRPVASS